MTFGKGSALAVGFACTMALGVSIGLSIAERNSVSAPGFEAYMSAPPSPVMIERTPAAAPVRRAVTNTSAPAIAPSAPELHARLKPLLNQGTNMASAAEGFNDARQFATLAHAARNTQVPFVILKQRVLKEGKSLASVIREFNAELDAAAEVNRARAEAAEDLAAIQG